MASSTLRFEEYASPERCHEVEARWYDGLGWLLVVPVIAAFITVLH